MRRPGWRKERGTHAGASRSKPPVRESSAATLDFVLPLVVLSWVTVFMARKDVASRAEDLKPFSFGVQNRIGTCNVLNQIPAMNNVADIDAALRQLPRREIWEIARWLLEYIEENGQEADLAEVLSRNM